MNHAPSPPRPLRLWPGIVIVALQWVVRFVVPAVAPATMPYAVMAGIVGGLAVVVWWLFFSRARWLERVGVLVLMIIAVIVTKRAVHASIATGMMGFLLPVYAIPVLSLALVAWAAATRNVARGPRYASLIAVVVVTCGGWALVRTGGFSSDLNHDWAWRWAPTREDRLLTRGDDKSKTVTTAATTGAGEWPGFRGARRDSVIHGVRIETNWAASPPVELWRREVGPGWSSFSVANGLLYTQEQRGDDEVVACYNLANGEPVWRHQDATRFWESNAGAGPRGTPTLHGGRVYTFGATGVLNALDAATGTVVWSRNAATDTKRKIPEWGFSSSPLVLGDLVIIAITGKLAAYDLATGAPRWSGPAEGGSYSSPHLLEIDGVPQILLMNGEGATSVAPADGKVLWQYTWKKGAAIVQPAQIAKNDLLISPGDRTGVRRIEVTHANDIWTTQERWTSTRLKPYFNDFVLHRGYAFGFDSGSLACVELEGGERKWKGGHYGSGQLVVLADQDVLLVLSEQGELALVRAAPEAFTELARIRALEGKTWNHPVLTGDVLLVRNDHEMAAFRLALKRG